MLKRFAVNDSDPCFVRGSGGRNRCYDGLNRTITQMWRNYSCECNGTANGWFNYTVNATQMQAWYPDTWQELMPVNWMSTGAHEAPTS